VHKFLCITILLLSMNVFAQDRCKSELELRNDTRPHSEKLTEHVLCLQRKIEKLEQETSIAPYKVCRVYIGGNWTDSLIVPKGWKEPQCRTYAQYIGATAEGWYALGCVSKDDFSFGDGVEVRQSLTKAKPPPNNPCGW
jgi:hypothetical protein